MLTTTDVLAPFTALPTALGDLARVADTLPEDPAALLDHLASIGAPMEQRGAAWQLLALAGLLEGAERYPSKVRQHNPVTEERKVTFLRVLSITGSTLAAAEAATPWQTGGKGGIQSFYTERDRDPEFADAWKRAEAAALARVEQEISRRAMTPERRPIFSKGEYVGEQLTYDNKLLLRLAARLNPEWSERRQVEHSGAVQHQHGHVVVSLQAADVLLLPAEQRQTFMSLLQTIADAKQAPAEPITPAIEHQP